MMQVRLVHALLAALLVFGSLALTPLMLSQETSSTLSGAIDRDGVGSWRWDTHPTRLQFGPIGGLDPARETLVIVAPRFAYGVDEVNALRAFLAEGGRILLADDSGVGRELLVQLDAPLRLTGVALYTPSFVERPERLVTLSSGALATIPDEVVLRRPVSVEGGTPLLLTPDLTWHDVNGNGRPDLDEPLAPAAVAAIATTRQGGTMLVVGQPDALLQETPLSRALLEWAGEGGRVLVVDEAHRHASDPLGLHAILAGRASLAATAFLIMLATAIVAVAVFAPRVRPVARKRHISAAQDPLLQEALSELDP